MKKDKKFTWTSIIIFEAIFIGVSVVGAILEWGFWITFIVAIVLLIIAFSILDRINNSACPKCGKKLSMKEISRKTMDTYSTTMDIQRQVRNSKGEVIETYTEAVPATKYIYECVDECKFCGHRQVVRRESTSRD